MCARIVQLADYGAVYEGSFVPMLRALAVEVQRRGHEITMQFSEGAHGRSWLSELETVADVGFMSAGLRPTVTRNVRRQVGRRTEPTVLHTHFGGFDVAAALAAAGRPRTAVFWHGHSRLEPEPLTRARRTLRFALLGPRVDGALCVSPEIRDAMRARCFPPARALYLPNAIDLARYPQIDKGERAAARKRLGLPANSRVILHFGWEWDRKGGELVLEVADLLATRLPDVLLATVLAEGARGAPIDEIDQRASMRRLEPSRDVNSLYAAADLFFSPSRAEGMPYSVLEALARGLPVVGTDIPGQRAILEDLAGSRVVMADPGRLAAAIEELLSTGRDQRAHEAAAARRILEESYTLESWVGQVVDIYERALARRGG
jgi:glycosyltransferase involved in cell wall biosynthesis